MFIANKWNSTNACSSILLFLFFSFFSLRRAFWKQDSRSYFNEFLSTRCTIIRKLVKKKLLRRERRALFFSSSRCAIFFLSARSQCNCLRTRVSGKINTRRDAEQSRTGVRPWNIRDTIIGDFPRYVAYNRVDLSAPRNTQRYSHVQRH